MITTEAMFANPLFVLFLLCTPRLLSAQFPAVCNTEDALQTKTCCPNNCSGLRGSCNNVTAYAASQTEAADPVIVNILRDAPNQRQKGTADARYQWPTVVFENVCVCNGNFGGVDCSECDFGWTGSDCSTRKPPVLRKSFARLSAQEKETFVAATVDLKREVGVWSVIVEEPPNYSTGTVMLQNVSTYDFFIYLHDYVARDGQRICRNTVDMGNIVDFAHSGPAFPVWHRRYMLTVEKEFQRIMGNSSFGFPYWQWEENDMSAFAEEYYGVPPNNRNQAVNVTGQIINPNNWNTICDLSYWKRGLNCSDYWRPCNPMDDLAERRPLQRGNQSTYLPNIVEVMIAIAAPSYDAANATGMYGRDSPRASFRSRLEGWNIICSAVNCTGPQDPNMSHMHNNVHDWMGGQMDDVPAAVNDPMFNLHHCNVDRVLESWMQRFTGRQLSSSSQLLPAYVPVSGGHPGHNQNDYMVPFFPLIRAGEQYRVAMEWGYVYDELIPANIPDNEISNCDIHAACLICDANATCIPRNLCSPSQAQTCPAPNSIPETGGLNTGDTASQSAPLGLGLGLGLPLLVAIGVITVLLIIIVYILRKPSNISKPPESVQMTVSS